MVGLYIDLRKNDDGHRLGFHYWKVGAFNQLDGIPGSKGRFLAFWSSLTNAAFSFLGTEIVALAAGEAENPKRNMPKAIRRVFWRLLFFYVFGVLIIGWTCPMNYQDQLKASVVGAAASPFVFAINQVCHFLVRIIFADRKEY